MAHEFRQYICFECNWVGDWATIVMLLLALSFETGWHHSKHKVKHSYHFGDLQEQAARPSDSSGSLTDDLHSKVKHTRLSKELVDRAGNEFMILGFLAFCIFIFNVSGGFDWCTSVSQASDFDLPLSAAEWLHLAEFIHMQLFFAMLVYFALISRAVRGSENKIKLWEKMCMQWTSIQGKKARALRRPSSLSTMDIDLESYTCWRQYFITRTVQWQQQRPAIFHDLMQGLEIDDAADDASVRFEDVLDKEFSFGAYLSLAVASGTQDSVQIHPITWFMVIFLFGFFALFDRLTHLGLHLWAPVFIIAAVTLLGVMRMVIVRKQHHMENRLHANSSTGDASPRVLDICRGHAKGSDGSMGTLAIAESTKRQFRQRHRHEIIMLRMLQVVLFLISYVFAAFMMNTQLWSDSTWLCFLCTSGFIILFASLAVLLPTAVPLFLGMCAMPPHIDEENFDHFCMLLLQNRARSEFRMWRELTKSYQFHAVASRSVEGVPVQNSKVLSELSSEKVWAEGHLSEDCEGGLVQPEISLTADSVESPSTQESQKIVSRWRQGVFAPRIESWSV
mmetsp:Transcript_53596/g.136024  ORF Transcript_53596/g.136024 Transcript_53596/m.136024 type:complete len:563 (+) Transcript_53596:67-1755(+)